MTGLERTDVIISMICDYVGLGMFRLSMRLVICPVQYDLPSHLLAVNKPSIPPYAHDAGTIPEHP